MRRSDHERARETIALVGAKDLSNSQQTWLRDHLNNCQACSDYAGAAGAVFRALRSDPIALDSDLVQATQMRLRVRAFELRQQRERFWLVCLSCCFVSVSTAITTALFWRIFEWVGEWVGIPSLVWQAGFAFFWIAPALVFGVTFVARGTHLTHNKNLEMQWK